MMNIFISIVVYAFSIMKSTDQTLDDLLVWFPFRAALSRRFHAISAVKTGKARPEIEQVCAELQRRMREHDRMKMDDAKSIVRDLPNVASVLDVNTAKELMRRYDTDLCGTLDALEMEELQEDLLKR